MLNDDFGAHIKRPVKTELSTGAEWELTMVPYTDAPPTWVVKRLRLVPGLVEFELVGDALEASIRIAALRLRRRAAFLRDSQLDLLRLSPASAKCRARHDSRFP